LGFLEVGNTVQANIPYNAGTAVNDWYLVTFGGQTNSAFNPQVRLTATDPNLAVDAVGDFGSYPIIFVGAQLGTQFPTNNDGMYFLHVYGMPTTSGDYTVFASD